jgi:cytochrome c oxidase subunit 2
MNFEVRAVSGADYQDYLQAREAGQSTHDALESIGQDGTATTTQPFDQLTESQRLDAAGN